MKVEIIGPCCAFLNKRFVMKVDIEPPGMWFVETPNHAKQIDGMSCGVYVLTFAERFLNGQTVDFHWSNDELVEARKRIASSLHAAGQMLNCQSESVLREDASPTMEGQMLNCQSESVLREDASPTKEDEEKHIDNMVDPSLNTSSTVEKRRYVPKKRRSSFLFPDIRKKKAKTLYCLCQRPYKKSDTMWSCDQCNDWFHPHCIGRDDGEEPPRRETEFLCEPCLSDYLKAWPVNTISELLLSSHDDDDDDDKEDDYFIKAEDVHKHMIEAYKRCWYIVRIEGHKSVLPWTKRHFNFLKMKGSATLYGFGEALFSPQAIATLEINIKNRFQRKKNTNAVYSMHNIIPSLANKDGKRLMEEVSGQSENYCKKVLVKEAMISIMQKVTGEDYSQIDQELKKTEGRKLKEVAQRMINYMKTRK